MPRTPYEKTGLPRKSLSQKAYNQAYYKMRKEQILKRRVGWRRVDTGAYQASLEIVKSRSASRKAILVALLGEDCSMCDRPFPASAMDFITRKHEKPSKVTQLLRLKDFGPALTEAKRCKLICAICRRSLRDLARCK